MSQEPMAFRCWEQWFLTEQFHHVFRPILHSLHGVSLPTAQKHIRPHSIPPGLCSTGSSNIRWLLSEPHKQQLLIKPPLTYSWSSMIFSPCWLCIRTYCLDLSVYYLWISSLPSFCRVFRIMCSALQHLQFVSLGFLLSGPWLRHCHASRGTDENTSASNCSCAESWRTCSSIQQRCALQLREWHRRHLQHSGWKTTWGPPPSRYSRSIIKLLIIEGPNLSLQQVSQVARSNLWPERWQKCRTLALNHGFKQWKTSIRHVTGVSNSRHPRRRTMGTRLPNSPGLLMKYMNFYGVLHQDCFTWPWKLPRHWIFASHQQLSVSTVQWHCKAQGFRRDAMATHRAVGLRLEGQPEIYKKNSSELTAYTWQKNISNFWATLGQLSD